MIRKFKEGLHGKKNFINKKDLSDAIFFEFEESIKNRFFSSSIQPQHCAPAILRQQVPLGLQRAFTYILEKINKNYDRK